MMMVMMTVPFKMLLVPKAMCPPLPGRPAKGCDFASPATAAHLTNLTRNEYSNHQ